MSAVELRKRIMDEVNLISDETILAEIFQLLHAEKNVRYELTDQEMQGVQDGLSDVENGRVFTSEEAHLKIKEWLKK